MRPMHGSLLVLAGGAAARLGHESAGWSLWPEGGAGAAGCAFMSLRAVVCTCAVGSPTVELWSCCSFSSATIGATMRGVNPLGFSPALLRGGDGRLGRSLDPILLYSQSYHSWTIVSVTAVTFTARSVHSRAADPDTLHFQGPAAARARSRWRSASCQLWLARHRTAPTRYSRPSRPRLRLS